VHIVHIYYNYVRKARDNKGYYCRDMHINVREVKGKTRHIFETLIM